MSQCTAKAKSTGEQCRRRAVSGYSVCQVHGAGSPKQGRPGGVNKVLKAGGRYSKNLPTRLSALYDEAQADPQILELRDEVALLDTRLGDVLRGVGEGDTRQLWVGLRKVWDDFEDATRSKDQDKQKEAIQDMGLIIKRGNAIYKSWSEIYGLVDQRRKTVESERKRLVEAHQVITVERLMLLITAIAGVVKQHVDDNRTINAIQHDIQGLLSSGT